MKKLLTFLILILSLAGKAQSKKIELFDLIVSLVPDAKSTTSNINWEALKTIKIIRWNNSKPTYDKVMKKFYKNGETKLTVNDKNIICGESSSSCLWSVSLEGNATGYNQFIINTDFTQDELGIQNDLKHLFGNRKYTAKVLKRCDEENTFFEITIPNKKPFYLHAYFDGGTIGSAFYVECFLNKKDKRIQCF